MNRPLKWCFCVPREGTDGKPWIVEQELALLNPAHWMDWHYSPLVPSSTYTPMLWSGNQASLDAAIEYMIASPDGETILLFNEPERPEQANMTPSAARYWTQAFLRAMWDTGKEFQWAAPGVSINMDDYDGLEWLTEYVRQMRRTGISRPSYWHVHSYRANSPEQLRAAWAKWMNWYMTWGEDAPVVLSEVCAEDVPDQRAVMDECRELLDRGENGGAVGVYWFASHPTNVVDWPNACLCEMNAEGTAMQLTRLGEHWISLK